MRLPGLSPLINLLAVEPHDPVRQQQWAVDQGGTAGPCQFQRRRLDLIFRAFEREAGMVLFRKT
jgi:hypothetical protein